MMARHGDGKQSAIFGMKTPTLNEETWNRKRPGIDLSSQHIHQALTVSLEFVNYLV